MSYRVPEMTPAQRSWAGQVSLAVALLLSPVVVFPVFVNDTTPEVLRPYAVPISIVAMIASLAWPAGALWHLSASGKAGRKWAIGGLAVSVIGWGCILVFALMWIMSGGLPSGVGVH